MYHQIQTEEALVGALDRLAADRGARQLHCRVHTLEGLQMIGKFLEKVDEKLIQDLSNFDVARDYLCIEWWGMENTSRTFTIPLGE